ncbi:MAG TPA: RNA methyltransferase [Streptosporangiaceae bacterium]|jgi:TrmH family RNA methyltransferase
MPRGSGPQRPGLPGEITTIRSPRVKAARQLARRAFRDRSRTFLAEGPQAVREALELPGTLLELFVTAAAASRHADLTGRAGELGIPVHAVSGEVMAELAQTVTPQGLLAVCRFLDVSLADLLATRPRLVAVLASVRDPGNAGTVLRTADAAGAQGVIFTAASVDPYNSKCVRSSAGSLFHLPVVTGADPAAAAAGLRAAGLQLLAADGSAASADGGRVLDPAAAAPWLAGPTAWLFGNEAWGLPAEVLALADAPVAVPIYGRAESLNLAAAAAVCLYASAAAQRGGSPLVSGA